MQLAAVLARSCSHVGQTVAGSFRPGLRIEAFAVIAHGKDDLSGFFAQAYCHAGRRGVLLCICQALLHDPIDGHILFRLETAAIVQFELALDLLSASEQVAVQAQGFSQIIRFQCRRRQLHHQTA